MTRVSSVALITGAAQGIGRSTALRLARDGYNVALADRNAAGITAVLAEIEQAGGTGLCVAADLMQLNQVQNAVDRACEAGPLDVLVNNAGRVIIHPFFAVTETEWDEILTLDLKTVFLQCSLLPGGWNPAGEL